MEDRSSKERDERRRACRCHRCERRKSARRERPRETRSDRRGKSSDGTGARVAILEADLVALPLPAWLPRDAAERGYALVQTRGNGDCLFESVSVALSTAMRGRPYTPTHLRKAVARTVTDASDRRASAALSAWRSMLEGAVRSSDDHDDGEMLRQVAHAYPLLFDADPPGPRTRKEVTRLMLDPAVSGGTSTPSRSWSAVSTCESSSWYLPRGSREHGNLPARARASARCRRAGSMRAAPGGGGICSSCSRACTTRPWWRPNARTTISRHGRPFACIKPLSSRASCRGGRGTTRVSDKAYRRPATIPSVSRA